nr:MAG TPA: hypothetical protein [Caudoviricetes sp.]
MRCRQWAPPNSCSRQKTLRRTEKSSVDRGFFYTFKKR